MASNRELSTLGRTLAEVQDDALQGRARPALSARLAAIYQQRARRERMQRRLSRFGYGAGAAVLAAAVMLFVMRPRALGSASRVTPRLLMNLMINLANR